MAPRAAELPTIDAWVLRQARFYNDNPTPVAITLTKGAVLRILKAWGYKQNHRQSTPDSLMFERQTPDGAWWYVRADKIVQAERDPIDFIYDTPRHLRLPVIVGPLEETHEDDGPEL